MLREGGLIVLCELLEARIPAWANSAATIIRENVPKRRSCTSITCLHVSRDAIPYYSIQSYMARCEILTNINVLPVQGDSKLYRNDRRAYF